MSNDYFKAQGWFKDYARNSQDSRGMFQRLVEADRLASAETDRIRDMINKKYGPGSMKYGSEISQPPARPDVIQMDAINAFMKRNPAAEGGRMRFDDGLSAKQKKALTITYPKDSTKDLEIKNVFLNEGKKSRFSAGSETIVIDGKEYLKITKKNSPHFGKYVFRGSESTGKKDSKGRTISKEVSNYFTESELRARIAEGSQTGKAKYIPTKEYTQSLEDIKTYVKSQGGVKKVYLSDLVEMFGDPTATETGRDTVTEKKIKKALGDDYDKLIKGGEQKKTTLLDKTKFNKLVRDVNRGDKPLIDLTQSKTNVAPTEFKKLLNPVELKMYEKLSPQFKAVLSRVIQPRQKYKAPDIKNISETTTKTFKKMMKQYPTAELDRGYLLKSGQSFNNKSYILSQIDRHIGEGGDLYSHVKGDTHATIKFRNNKTNKLITYNNIDINDPEFKEAADVYDEWKKTKDTKIDNPLKKGEKITIAKSLEAGGDKLVKDHLDPDGVKGNPLKNLVITTQKANMAGQIKNKTPEQIADIGRGLKLSLEDNIKRYTKYGKRLMLNKAVDPEFKIKSPTQTILDAELKSSNIDYVGGKKDFVGVNSGFNTDLLMKDPAIQKLVNSEVGQKIANNLKKAARGTAGTVGKAFGVADILIGVLDYQNNISKNESPNVAFKNALQAASINMWKGGDRAVIDEVKERFVKQGGDGEIFDQATALNKKDQEINDLIFDSKKKADTFVQYAKEGRGTLTPDLEKSKADYEVLKKNLNAKIAEKMSERDNMIESYKTNLRVSEAGAPIQIGGSEFFGQPFKDIKQSTMDRIEEQNKGSYDMQKRQVNYMSGDIGNWMLNNLITMSAKEKAELQRQINNMDERELYKFNLSRGMDPDNLIRFQDVLKYRTQFPELMGVNTTKYVNYDDRKAEGGITELRSKYEYKK